MYRRLRRLVIWGALGCALSLLVAGPTPTGAEPTDLPDLEGRWAQRFVQTAIADPPIIGKTTSWMYSYYIVEVRQQGQEVTLWSHPCDFTIESDAPFVRTTFPAKFVRAVPDNRRTGTLRRTDNGVELAVDRHTVVLGANLRHKTAEQLPDSPEDHRIIDDDRDGHPGVTVKIEGLLNADVYVVQRGWDRYTASPTSDSRLRGLVDWNAEQRVVGSTSIFIRKTPPIEPHSDPERSYVEMVRLPDGAKCRDLERRKSSLFAK